MTDKLTPQNLPNHNTSKSESNSLLGLYQIAPECVKLITAEGNLLEMNEAGLRMIEADSFAQVANHCVFPLIHPEHQGAFRALCQDVFAGKTASLTFKMVGLKGTERWLETHATPQKDTLGKITSLLGITRDITQQRLAENALIASELRLKHLSEVIPQQVWAANPSGELTYVNKRVTDYFAVSEAEILGSGWKDLIHPEDLPLALEHWSHALASGDSYEIDFRLRQSDGTYRWHIGRALPLRNAQGAIIEWFGSNTDISDRKEAEVALAKSEARLIAAQNHALIGNWELDLATGTGSLSSEWFQIMGRDPDTALGNPSFEEFVALIHPEDQSAFIAFNVLAKNSPESTQHDFRVQLPNGDFRWIESRAKCIFNTENLAVRMVGTVQDISSRKHTEMALQESQSRLAAAQARAKLGSWRRNATTKKAEWSAEMHRLVGSDPKQEPPTFDQVVDLIHPDDRQSFIDSNKALRDNSDRFTLDVRLCQPDNSYIWIEVRNEAIRDNAGQLHSITGTFQDITERKEAEISLRESSDFFEVTHIIAKLGGWGFDIPSQTLYWSDHLYRILETTPEEVTPTMENGMEHFTPESKITLNEALEKAIETGQGYDLELQMYTLKGRLIEVRATCTVLFEKGRPIKLHGILQDISEQKTIRNKMEAINKELAQTNQKLKNIAHYDSLTHLPNRVLLADRMQQAMIRNQRLGQSIAVAFLDLDGFKVINDTYGHSMGDDVLINIAHRMKSALREMDTLARLGGDEFVAVLSDLEHPSACEPLLKRLLTAASSPIRIGDISLEISASIGVTLYPQDGVDAEQLLRHADQAMYLAKQAGKNCFHIFDVAKDVALKNQLEALENIRQGLVRNEFVLFYQPKVNMRTGNIIGVEALIRWQHPEQGLLPPIQFLPTIENDPLSITLGEWVITTALNQITTWQQQGLELAISVNLGAYQLQQDNFIERLEFLLKQCPNHQHNQLSLEILETSAFDDIAQVSTVITACKALGVNFALDDFGTGYSSLTYLKRLPAELLKIDQSFVRDMLEDHDDLAIIQGIIGLAAAFNRQVIAEGVETLEHGKKLLAIGCELAQGYGIARPMPATAIPEWVTSWREHGAWVS